MQDTLYSQRADQTVQSSQWLLTLLAKHKQRLTDANFCMACIREETGP